MKRFAFVALAVALLGAASNAEAYFPVYHGQPLYTTVGRFIDFRNGPQGGGVIVQDANGARVVYRSSFGMTFAGRPTTCFKNPTHNGIPSGCTNWPPALVVGARVRVTFWIERSRRSPSDRIARAVSPI